MRSISAADIDTAAAYTSVVDACETFATDTDEPGAKPKPTAGDVAVADMDKTVADDDGADTALEHRRSGHRARRLSAINAIADLADGSMSQHLVASADTGAGQSTAGMASRWPRCTRSSTSVAVVMALNIDRLN
jgi:hypothetical protein